MAMTSASEFGIFGAAARIVLNGDTRPVVDGVGEAVVAGLSSDDDAALSGPLATGATPARLRKARRSRVAAGHLRLSASSVARTVLPTPGKDARISRVMLLFLPWLGRPGWHEASGQAVDPAMGVS